LSSLSAFRWPSFGGRSAVAATLCAAVILLVFFGYRATDESKRSLRMLLDRQQAEQLALLWAGVTQDMKGAHATVLVPVTPSQLLVEPPYNLADAFARGFARFSYPESFFAWAATNQGGEFAYAFNRADRPPNWQVETQLTGPYPVTVLKDPPALLPVLREAQERARFGRPLALFEMELAGVPYQVVASLFYLSDRSNHLFGMVGFTVNLDWVREAYFQELTSQIARIGGEPEEVSLQVVDHEGLVVTSTQQRDAEITPAERPFPLAFVDRVLLGSIAETDRRVRTWTARVGVASGSPIMSSVAGTDFTFVIIAVAAIAAVVGVLMTGRSARLAEQLADMKADFVSSVTHELKSPLAVIQLVSDTLERGSYESERTVSDYAQLLSKESKELTRLVDNLLAYSRLTDASSAYSMEPADVGDLVDAALARLRPLLEERQFTVEVDVPVDLPAVWADTSAMALALDNVIDNAVKYSGDSRVLSIQARATQEGVAIGIADRGVGIHPEAIPLVTDKFVRGRGVRNRGSGLGLAITRQIVEAHGGRLVIESQLGQGTRVDLLVPIYDSHSDRRGRPWRGARSA